jgi:hypothetical protein
MKPIALQDEPARALLLDILDANVSLDARLEALRDWVHRTLRTRKATRLDWRRRTRRIVRAALARRNELSAAKRGRS